MVLTENSDFEDYQVPTSHHMSEAEVMRAESTIDEKKIEEMK
jgi:hypothetical protein